MNKCINCGSDDTIKVSQLYIKSTQILDAKTAGGGVGLSSWGIGAGWGIASSTGNIQSIEGQKIAPPKKPSNVGYGIALLAILFL